MKRFIYNILLLGLVLGISTTATAQRIFGGEISMPGELKQTGNTVYLNLDIDLNDLSLNTNRSLILIPVLRSTTQTAEFPPIVINGKKRHKAYERSIAYSDWEDIQSAPVAVVQLKKNQTRPTLFYRETLPYSSWMNDAYLEIHEELCDCGGEEALDTSERLFSGIDLEQRFYAVTPQIAYIQPQAEPVKNRSEQFEVYLNFQVGKTNILPEFGNNQAELNKLNQGFNVVKSDANISVTDIEIAGYASPEGSVALNDRLSKGRAEALQTLLAQKGNFPASVYHVTHGGEDWVRLQELVEASGISQKEEILSIIRNTADPTQRQNKLVAMGATYRILLNDYYPKLRRVVCNINYSVRNFTIDESKEILKTKPQQLSLNEMFLIANTYKEGINEFNEVFETAVRLFPSDQVANQNAAAAAISRGDLTRAKSYLEKADSRTPEYANNMGVIYFLQGDYDNARAEFNRTIAGGSSAARENLEEMNKKIEIEVRPGR